MTWLLLLLGALLLLLLLLLLGTRRHGLEHLPGPPALPLLGNLHLLKPACLHTQLLGWAVQYGPVYRVLMGGHPIVVVTGTQQLYNCLIRKGRDFMGRPHTFRMKLATNNFHDVIVSDDSPARQVQKKSMSQQIKAFGLGLQRVEEITTRVLHRFISTLTPGGPPVDLHALLEKLIIHITYIITFERELTDTAEEEEIRRLKDMGIDLTSPDIPGQLLDAFPWLRYLGHPIYKQIQQFREDLHTLYVNKWRRREEPRLAGEDDDSDNKDGNLTYKLLKYIRGANTAGLDDDHVKYGTYQMFVAGVSTTTETLSAFFNVLTHHPDIQGHIQAEIDAVLGKRQVKIDDRQQMPYTQATILELLRYTTVVFIMLPHKTMVDTEVDGHKIPAGTELWMNNWGQCHDSRLYDEPFTFRPERFLDEQGELVLADHPNRVNMVPFGAGNRVCAGETFAMSRMFLVIVMMLQRFSFLPASSRAEQPSCDPRAMKLGIVLNAPQYSVRVAARA